MGRWSIVIALCLAGLACRGQQPAGVNPFDTRTRVAPPNTGTIGGGGDPYLSGTGAQANPSPIFSWPWSGGSANTPPSLPAQPTSQPGVAPAPAGNGFLPSTWFGRPQPAATSAPTLAPGSVPGAVSPVSPGSYGPAGAPPGATFLPTGPGAAPAAAPGAFPAGTPPTYPAGSYPSSALPNGRAAMLAGRSTVEPPPAIFEPVGPPRALPPVPTTAAAMPRNTAVLSPTGVAPASMSNVTTIELSSLPDKPLAR